eukprot:TRINITY_DN2320_c0_g1_i1.p1 TRINITY_DN2320_c0_g1~~TRINITY_DN2320_c0_g1_i1.p1  ORF type:complete len:221 (-),score=43.37 TRINITY_DN2320_c0_g1_i1:92-754(-)
MFNSNTLISFVFLCLLICTTSSAQDCSNLETYWFNSLGQSGYCANIADIQANLTTVPEYCEKCSSNVRDLMSLLMKDSACAFERRQLVVDLAFDSKKQDWCFNQLHNADQSLGGEPTVPMGLWNKLLDDSFQCTLSSGELCPATNSSQQFGDAKNASLEEKTVPFCTGISYCTVFSRHARLAGKYSLSLANSWIETGEPKSIITQCQVSPSDLNVGPCFN